MKRSELPIDVQIEKKLVSICNEISLNEESKDLASQLLEEEKVAQSIDLLEDLDIWENHKRTYLNEEVSPERYRHEHEFIFKGSPRKRTKEP